MALSNGNVILHGASGTLGGQVVIRRNPQGGLILSVPPRPQPDREPTPAQAEQREQFRQGCLYGKGAKTRPEYAPVAESRGTSTYNVAVADFLNPPQVLEVKLEGYVGGIGQTIGVVAVDDVKVVSVRVNVMSDTNVVLESGQAAPSAIDPRLWTYTTTTATPPSVKVEVVARDLADQTGTLTAHS